MFSHSGRGRWAFAVLAAVVFLVSPLVVGRHALAQGVGTPPHHGHIPTSKDVPQKASDRTL